MARSTDKERSTAELAPCVRTRVTPGRRVPVPIYRAHRHAPGPATRLLLGGGRRFHGNQVMRAARLQLAVIGQHGRHLASSEETDGGLQVDCVERADLHRREAGCAFERSTVDGNEANRRKQPLSSRDDAFACGKPAQLHDQQLAGPSDVVPGQRRSNRDCVGLGEQDPSERGRVDVEPGHQYGRSRSADRSRSVVPAG